MKLIISLIFILSIVLNNCIAFLENQNSNKNGALESNQVCFPNGDFVAGTDGFQTNVKGVGYDMYFPTLKHGEVRNSYCQENVMDIDFLNQRVSINFTIDIKATELTVIGKFWAFSSNKTEYIYTLYSNGIETCFLSKMNYSVTPSMYLIYAQDIELGKVPCESYFAVSPLMGNETIREIIVDKESCSLLTSISTVGFGESIGGESIALYYNYVPNSNPNSYNLPSACNNPTIIEPITRPEFLNLFTSYEI
ncbi:hypothetical protein ACTA71_007920 [Dictyostelium dimigraforme]